MHQNSAVLGMEKFVDRRPAEDSEYDKTSIKTDSGTLYVNKSGESGSELAEAFRDVVKQIKDSLAADIQAEKIRVRTM